jgi:hypothetical protein
MSTVTGCEGIASPNGRYYLVSICDGYHFQSAHDDFIEAIVAMAKFRATHRHTVVVIRCGETGARLSVQDCEDYMLPECRLTSDEDPRKVWQRLAA